MENFNFITSSYFWNNVYLIGKSIFILLSFILTVGIIWLIIKISNFRQKLNIQNASQEYKKITISPEINPSEKTPEKESVSIPDQTSELAKSKWEEIMMKIDSESEEDWKMSIIKADTLLDTILKRNGYPGETVKERLNYIKHENILDMNRIFEAHRARNEIVHNTGFSLSKNDALKFLKIYKKALEDLKII